MVSRSVVETESTARADLGPVRKQPAWLAGRHALPFQDLSDDEFEVFAYLLLLREHPDDRVVYYGKTGDAGRDVVRAGPGNAVELIQCKRYTSNVGLGEVRGELAKLCTNIFKKLIPAPPVRVVFYAVPDLTAPAKDLLGSRDKWLAACEEALETHLGEKPPPELVTFAKSWWPEFDHEDEHKLTERARKHQELIKEFFLVRHVVTGSIAEIEPRLAGVEQSVESLRTRFEEVAGGVPAQTSAQIPAPEARAASQGGQMLHVRMLVAKVSTLEERDRQHLDEVGQRLITEIQGAVRTLDLRQAVAAAPRLEAWLAAAGAKASASVRGRTAVLLADLAIIEEAESRGGGRVDTAPARRWHARAVNEFTADASSEDAARLAALEAKLLSLEGKDAEAVELAATAPDDPACMTTRLSALIDRGSYADAVRAAGGVTLHERWCDRLVIAHTALGDVIAAEAIAAAAKRQFDQQTHRRCLLALAQGRLQGVITSWPEAQTGLPAVPPEEISQSLRAALDDLKPLLLVAEANERVGNGLEAEAVACAVICARLLGDRVRAAALADLLGTREPVHLEYARAAFRGDIKPPADLPGRLRRDHPNHFEARSLGALLAGAAGTGSREAFADGLELVRIATSDAEKGRAIGVLLELAAEAPEGALEEAERAAASALSDDHRLTRFIRAARFLAAKNADEAAPVIEALRDEDDPLWRQLAATLCLLRADDLGALDHLIVASRVLARPEVLDRTANLALRVARYETAEEVLDRLVALRPRDTWGWGLLASVCVRLGRHGRAARAFAALRELEPNVLAHGVNHAKSLALSGRREEAVRVFDAVCARHPQSLEALGGRAHLLDVLGRPAEALSSLTPARELFWSEPSFLLLYHSLGYRAGREEEAHLALARLLELQREGREVPLWTLNLNEVLEEFRARRRAHEERNLELLRGRIPWLAAGRVAGRAALGDWAFRTQDLLAPPDDPHERAEFTVYATNGWAVRPDGNGGRALRRIACCPSPGTPVVADLSALISLHHLGLLGHAATHFGRILLPTSYAELALTELTDYQPHQPTRLDTAREILASIDRGQIVAPPDSGLGEPLPLLDEYEEGTAYRLRDIAAWLHEAGHIDERRAGEALSTLRDRGGDSSLPPVRESARRGFRTSVMTLEAAIHAGLFPDLVRATRLSLPAEAVREVRARLWGAEHQARLAREHESLWAAVQGDERFEFAEVGLPASEEGDERDRRLEAVFDGPLLAEARKVPLLTDDRAFQTIVINGRLCDACPAFGTDCLLLALADSGVVTEDQLADAFLTLLRRRYRFLLPPVRVLTTLAARHRAHPPGGPLREVSRYVHDCFRDPGLLAGVEPSEPPVSVACESYRHWVQHVARFVVHLRHDDRFDDRGARELTVWAFGELLPSPPASLPRMGAVVLCHSTAHHVVGTAYSEVWRFRNRERAARAIREVAAALRLTRAEYLEIAGDYLDLLSTQPATGDDPEALREVHGLLADTALSPVRTVGPRVYFALARLGVMADTPGTPPPDELVAVLDPVHERRIPNPPGPVVLLRVLGKERTGEAVNVTDYLLHPARTVRETAVTYLGRAPEGSTSWLSPRSRAVLAETAGSIRSEVQAEWLPAARRLFDVLDEDFLLNLAGFRQCWAANLREEQAAYWRRVIRPGIHLAASVPPAWFEIPSTDVAADCVVGASSLAEALDRHFVRCGHLPLTPPASAGSVVRRWADTSGARSGVWEAVWRWADAGLSPFRAYHACQVFIECPDLIPDGQSAVLWERVCSIHTPTQGVEDGETPAPPDLTEVGWELRRELARHYLGQLELHTSEQPGDRLAALAWWAAERVAGELTESLQSAGIDTAAGLQNAIERAVSREAELTDIAWDALRPAGSPSTFAFGTMEACGLWTAALLAAPGPGIQLTPDHEHWVAINLLAMCLGGFPPPGVSPGSAGLAFNGVFDEAAAEWARRIGTDENHRFLLEVLDLRRELATRESLLRHLRTTPEAEPHRQAVVCNAFLSLAALGGVSEGEVWNLLTDNEWVRGAVTRLEPGPLQGFVYGLIEVQRRAGGRWHWALPHLLGSLAEELDLPPERRRLLALATVRSATIGGGVNPIRRLLFGSRQEQLGTLLAEWRDQFVVVRTLSSPLVTGYLRGITSALSR